MAKTYSAIQTYTLSSSTSSITFFNIPQNYTDLKIVYSTRADGGSAPEADLNVTFNNVSSGYSERLLYTTNGTSISSYSVSSQSYFNWGSSASSSNTASTFSNGEIYIPNYTSGSNKTIFAEVVVENNATAANIQLDAGLVTITNPITTITLTSHSTNFVSGSTFTLYGIGSGAKATGGAVVGAGNYIYHTFTSTGTFTPTEQIKNVEVLSIAGGGGGGGTGNGSNGGYPGGGGGGAGGVLYTLGNSLNAGTNYAVIVGSGGAGKYQGTGSGASGTSSYLGTITAAVGGGGGASWNGTPLSGGSGGGADGSGNTTTAGAAGTQGQGYAGGSWSSGINGGAGGGGAGGTGGAGSVSSNSTGGTGGVGTANYSSWLYATQTGVSVGGTYYIAGGGGGGSSGLSTNTPAAGVGGTGGGGQGGQYNVANTVANGTSNTGGGGGGAGQTNGATGLTGGNGGSGLVIIRYPVN